MYKRLLPLVNHYVLIETMVNSNLTCYKGLLIDVTPDVFEIETYAPDGSREGRWVGLTPSITSLQVEGRELQELSLHIKFRNAEATRDQSVAEGSSGHN